MDVAHRVRKTCSDGHPILKFKGGLNMECRKCGYPLFEIQGVYRQEPKREERKVCLNCLKKKVEELEIRLEVLEGLELAFKLNPPKPKRKIQ